MPVKEKLFEGLYAVGKIARGDYSLGKLGSSPVRILTRQMIISFGKL